ncbi:MAG: zinc ribbon domain-containing protein [Actinobacteria bacterium]|nr:zinc ribbon domain-containing protein [Actinomycetota bacterium]
MKSCQVCGALNITEAKFCTKCGSEIKESYIFCIHCGKKVLSSNQFCKYCGSEVKGLLSSDAAASSINKITQPTQVSVKKIIPEKTLAPTKPRKSRKKLVITLSVVLPIIFLLAMFITLVAVFGKGIPDGLSKEQKRLISSFGHPGEYAIIFDRANSKRFDMWVYPELERYFLFENGKYSGGKEVINPDLKKDEIKVGPEDFTKNMKINDVINVLGVQPEKDIDNKAKLTVLTFYNGLLAVSFNEKEEIINVSRTKTIN